jgi:hypothetical protein
MQYSPVPSPEGTKETYWETKAPSSDVLGIGSGVSSGTYITASVVAAIVGGFCTGEVTAELSRTSLQGFWSGLAGCGGVAPAAAGVSQRAAPETDLRACAPRCCACVHAPCRVRLSASCWPAGRVLGASGGALRACSLGRRLPVS